MKFWNKNEEKKKKKNAFRNSTTIQTQMFWYKKTKQIDKQRLTNLENAQEDPRSNGNLNGLFILYKCLWLNYWSALHVFVVFCKNRV